MFGLVALTACSSTIDDGAGKGNGTSGSGTGAGTGNGGGSGVSGAGPSTGGSSGTAGVGAGGSTTGGSPGTEEACPTIEVPRTALRRLTRFEYASTVRDLLGVDPALASELPADEVTNGFDNNAAVLTVSSLHAEKYVLVSEALARAAVQNLAALTACDAAAQGEDACALDFARRFGRRAFRRPTTPEDEALLLAAYAAGRTDGSYAEGIEVMVRAALLSPHFLYRLETTTPVDETSATPAFRVAQDTATSVIGLPF